MGGLDLCFGRWDTHQHQIAYGISSFLETLSDGFNSDNHPAQEEARIWPGQDFNNGRIMDFENVAKYYSNKLDRATNSRMGWSDISLSIKGPVVEDLRVHFLTRWNWICSQLSARSIGTRYATPSTALSSIAHDWRGQVPEATAAGIISEPGATLQILRSCSEWSHGISTEVPGSLVLTPWRVLR
jgi:phospholipase D1/2